MRSLRSRRRGFTLIEIMIVVAIVGVLAGLAAAQLRQQQTRSRFRSSVREMVGLIREARSNALLMGSGIATAGTVFNVNCPPEMLPNVAPLNFPDFRPGLVLDTTNNQVTLVDSVQIVLAPPGTAGSCVAGSCLVNNFFCASNADCPGFPQYRMSCRTEDFTAIYRNEARFIGGGLPGTPLPGALGTLGINGTRAVIGFNGRGMMVTGNPAQPVGRVVMQENVATPMSLSVIVSAGGSACIEGAANQCARMQ